MEYFCIIYFVISAVPHAKEYAKDMWPDMLNIKARSGTHEVHESKRTWLKNTHYISSMQEYKKPW